MKLMFRNASNGSPSKLLSTLGTLLDEALFAPGCDADDDCSMMEELPFSPLKKGKEGIEMAAMAVDEQSKFHRYDAPKVSL